MKGRPTQREALEALWDYGEPGDWCPLVRLSAVASVPQKVALRKIEKLVDKGYADYGTSPAYAWRTPKGDERLKELTTAVVYSTGFSAGATPTDAPKPAVPPPGAVDLFGREETGLP